MPPVSPWFHRAGWLFAIAVIAIASALVVRTSTEDDSAEPPKAAAPATKEAAPAPKEPEKPVTRIEEDSSTTAPKADTVTPPSAPSSATRKGARDQLSKAAPVRDRPSASNGPKRSARCSDLLGRQQLGEVLSGDDQALFQKECQR